MDKGAKVMIIYAAGIIMTSPAMAQDIVDKFGGEIISDQNSISSFLETQEQNSQGTPLEIIATSYPAIRDDITSFDIVPKAYNLGRSKIPTLANYPTNLPEINKQNNFYGHGKLQRGRNC